LDAREGLSGLEDQVLGPGLRVGDGEAHAELALLGTFDLLVYRHVDLLFLEVGRGKRRKLICDGCTFRFQMLCRYLGKMY